MIAAWGLTNRGNKIANFAVLRETACPAVLHELAFITNATDAAKLASPAERQKAAEAHLRAIQRHFNITPYIPGGGGGTTPPQDTDGEVAGHVTDGTGPVVGATVKLDDGASVLTDAEGAFVFTKANVGAHTVSASADGYASKMVDVAVAASARAEVEIVLEPGDVGATATAMAIRTVSPRAAILAMAPVRCAILARARSPRWPAAPRMTRALLLLALLAPACMDDGVTLSETAQEAGSVCADGPTTYGIDVSRFQGDINWQHVAGSGVKFAYIQISRSLTDIDAKFAYNWPNAKANGILRGAYQRFHPGQDVIGQAKLFLEKLGPFQVGDLPPMLDVEDADGLTAAQIAAAVKQWMNYVEPRVGVKPLIYTGFYFWRDSVGSADFSAHPLWIANYGATCPLVPDKWTRWAFHQYSSTVMVPGITANTTDVNKFNGTLADLKALSAMPMCGDEMCNGDETVDSCAMDCKPCQVIGDGADAIVDDASACFSAGGDPQFIREENAGYGSKLKWTHTTDLAAAESFGRWELYFANRGYVSRRGVHARRRTTGPSRPSTRCITTARSATHRSIRARSMAGTCSASSSSRQVATASSSASMTTPASPAARTPSSCSMRFASRRSPRTTANLATTSHRPATTAGCTATHASSQSLIWLGLAGLLLRRRRTRRLHD